MDKLRDLFALIGRVGLSAIFIKSGISKIGTFTGTSGYIASKGLPMPEVLAAIAIIVEVPIAIALVIGWKTRWMALILAVFTLLAAFLFHNYWTMPPEKQMIDNLSFWKNIAIAGGFLVVAAFGAGRFSVDKH
jgi:putative oxidoreductase